MTASATPARAELLTGIIGGTEATPGAYPWQVFVSTPNWSCGGTLLDAGWVLTAAHCANGVKSEDITVYAGMHELAVTGETQARDVAKVLVHEGWCDPFEDTSCNYDNDIALLKLASAVDCSNCAPIQRVTPENEAALVVPGSTIATVTGWGDTDPDPLITDFATALQEVDVTVIDLSQCRELYDPAWVTGNMICALESGKDACQGDSGGPMIVPKEDGTGYLLAGIVSWGDECAKPNAPGVYTRVASYDDWIAQRIDGGGGGGAPGALLLLLPLAAALRRYRTGLR